MVSAENPVFDEIMAYDKRNSDVFKVILKQYKNKRIVPFVGAGMSVDAGFPTWEQFIALEYEKEGWIYDKERPSDLLDAASDLCRHIGMADLRHDVVNTFGSLLTTYEWNDKLSSIQDKAAGLLPKLFNGVMATTNFDRLLEQLYPSIPVTHPGQLNRAVQAGEPLIFKLHGCISNPEDIILTREYYEKAYPAKGKKTEVIRSLERIFTGQFLLFLGCSLKR